MKIVAWLTALIAVVTVVLWLFVGVMADAWHIMTADLLNVVWRTWLFPNGWNLLGATPFFWLLVLLAGCAIAFAFSYRRDMFGSISTPTWLKAVVGIAASGWIILLIQTILMTGLWNAQHYNSATTYVVADTNNLPNSLQRISTAPKAQIGIETGAMPDAWERRTNSATGAAYVMQTNGESNTNTQLLTETISYNYSQDGGSWTAIRNGNRRQPIFGVATWAGAGQPVESCQFEGDNELNKGFNVGYGKNLSDDIAQFDPNFRYDMADVYGYCDDDKPVIVIPGARIIGLQRQSVLSSYGVMIITGSKSGEPVIEFRDTVAPGELPGPAYPTKLVEKQRNNLDWSAGRIWPWQPGVGFETSNSASQVGNTEDFLLKSKVDGRLYWVTPLKPRNTDSETIVAYAMVAADEVKQGKLNEQRVYVLNDGDARIVNFNQLQNAVVSAIKEVNPGFFTGEEDDQGKIAEFVPLGNGSWQVFAELGGRAEYRIDVTGGAQMQTTVVKLSDSGDIEPGNSTADSSINISPATPTDCNAPSGLTKPQLGECIRALTEELVNRE